MKKIFILIVFCLSFVISIFSQEIHGIATYKLKLGEDFTFFNAQLLFTGTQSYFVWKQQNKSVWKIHKNEIIDGSPNLIDEIVYTDTIGHIVLRDLNKSYLQVRDFCTPKHPMIYNDSINFNWKISNESQMVQGLKCQLATCHFRGRDYKAWFYPVISLPYGPWKFGGLPGLIVEIQDSKQEVLIQLKNIDLKQRPQFDTNLKGEKTSMQKFIACKDKEWKKSYNKDMARFARLRAKFPDLEITVTEIDRRPATELNLKK